MRWLPTCRNDLPLYFQFDQDERRNSLRPKWHVYRLVILLIVYWRCRATLCDRSLRFPQHPIKIRSMVHGVQREALDDALPVCFR